MVLQMSFADKPTIWTSGFILAAVFIFMRIFYIDLTKFYFPERVQITKSKVLIAKLNISDFLCHMEVFL